MKFKGHRYEYTHPFSSTRHHWEVRGPLGGVHFHVSIMDDDDKFPEPSCGLEFHFAEDPTNGQRAPDHLNCPVTGGRCWHDGTSLYASETLWPSIKFSLREGDHQAVFRILEREYDDRIERDLKFSGADG